DAQQLTRGQGRKVAEIEEKRATLKPEVHIKPWICERFIDQMGIKASWHGRSGRVRKRAGNDTGNDADGLPQSKWWGGGRAQALTPIRRTGVVLGERRLALTLQRPLSPALDRPEPARAREGCGRPKAGTHTFPRSDQ